ncbi:CHAT domain-containing protein [Streptomyces sp. NBC_00063]|uniref:CHAT domain-containing protein n=1 Tax=Streptomyces sp. NBC_00063 TaxID=2975638 RepID=UPI00224E94C8|nr:CHAT domain-containing protein [Streptomyces sp. NBC_00063]MCX5443910.1 CHAT domain-containing protein [Streptomyces sp. NBC_00063]
MLIWAAYQPLVPESWRFTPPLLRVLLPLGCIALFACIALVTLAAIVTFLGHDFDLIDSPRQLWAWTAVEVREFKLTMLVMNVPLLVWVPALYYKAPAELLRIYVIWAASKVIESGDLQALSVVTAPLRVRQRLPSVNASNEATLALLESMTLLSRLDRTEEAEALDASLARVRRGLAVSQAFPSRASQDLLWWLRKTLGIALWERYRDTLSSTALDDAIRIRRELADAPRWAQDPDFPNLLPLSEALGARFDRHGDERDLRDAIEAAEQVVNSHPSTTATKVRALCCLGEHHIRGVRKGIGGMAAWEAAIAVLSEGAALETRIRRLRCRYQLVLALIEAPSEGPRAESLVEAERLAREMADAAAPQSRAEGEYRLLLGLVLQERVKDCPDPTIAMWEECARAYRAAAEQEAMAAHLRLLAARLWGSFAAKSAAEIAAGQVTPDLLSDAEDQPWSTSADGLALAVELLPLVAWRGVVHHDQRHYLLAPLKELAIDAAAVAIRAGRPERAVELLERGRTLTWSQQLDLRKTELSRLRDDDPEMFAQLDAIREELDKPLSADSYESPERAERHTALAREWEARTRETGLLRFPDYRTLRTAGAEGPVVIVNISEFGCHALVVRDEERPPAVIPLDTITHADVREALDRTATADGRLVQALANLREAQGRAAEAIEAAEALVIRAEMRRTQTSIRMLDWLWKSIAQPVLDALTELDTHEGELPRLWWCPAGLATYLPLHAAGARHGGARDSVPGCVVPSYTATLTSLLHARRPQEAPHTGGGLLLLTVPEPDLPDVDTEAEIVARHVPEAVRLHGDRATVDAVTRLLPVHTRFHAICHGVAREGLRIGGGEILTPIRLAQVPAMDAEFAFLSACDTAVPDPEVPDEAIHPAAVLHFGGFRHVLASLHAVQDASAPAVTDALYGRLVRDGVLEADQTPRVLHATLAELREEHAHQPKIWMPYIHIGA